MKNILSIVLTFLVCSSGFTQSDTLLSAFRSVNISKGKKVKLQASMTELTEISKKVNKNLYILNKEAFNYVDSLGIEVDDKNKIIALTFLYGYDSAYVHEEVYYHEQKKYKKLIAAEGKEYKFKSDNFSIRVNRWEDKETIYELIETIKNGKLMVYSRIFDKKLYYQKYSKLINLSKGDNSIELLRRIGVF
jgi:hypothetical protein